jgi:outer membrane protein OmpA-like peptidoglycan-associated protein
LSIKNGVEKRTFLAKIKVMKRLLFPFLLLLGGCSWFKTSTEPNPKLSDTAVVLSKPDETVPLTTVNVQEIDVTEETAPWYGLYDEKDVIGRIFFEFDSSVVSERDRAFLKNKIVPLLKKNPQQRLLLAGYADWYGEDVYNQNIGTRRAQSVADVLTSLGISHDRLDAITLGNREATRDINKEDAVKDRRCDIVLLH